MAVSILGTPSAASGTSPTASVANTVSAGSNRVAYIFVYSGGGTTVTSMNTFGGVAPVLVGTGSDYLHAYRVLSPATGATTATANLSGEGLWSIHVIVLQDVDTSDADDTLVSNTNSELASVSLASVASATGDLVVAFGHMIMDNIQAFDGATLSSEVESISGAFQSSAVVWEAGAATVTLGVSVSGTETFGDNLIIGFNVNAATGGGAVHYTLTAEQGLYTTTGQIADIRKSRGIIADVGFYTITGSIALIDSEIDIEAGSYAVTGQAANLLIGRKLMADAGAHVVVGSEANLVFSGGGPKVILCEQGVYTSPGQNAELRRAAKLVCASTSYNISGFSVVGGVAVDEETISFLFRVKRVLVVTTTNRTKWVHYIPVKQVPVTAQNISRFQNEGAIEVKRLSSGTGLVEWVDYIPVVEVGDAEYGRWRYDNAGWIPILIVE